MVGSTPPPGICAFVFYYCGPSNMKKQQQQQKLELELELELVLPALCVCKLSHIKVALRDKGNQYYYFQYNKNYCCCCVGVCCAFQVDSKYLYILMMALLIYSCQ
jgi:hypothetical protein